MYIYYIRRAYKQIMKFINSKKYMRNMHEQPTNPGF